jgi:hypothetical protein
MRTLDTVRRRRAAAATADIGVWRSENLVLNSPIAGPACRSLRTPDHRCVCDPFEKKGGQQPFSALARILAVVAKAAIHSPKVLSGA